MYMYIYIYISYIFLMYLGYHILNYADFTGTLLAPSCKVSVVSSSSSINFSPVMASCTVIFSGAMASKSRFGVRRWLGNMMGIAWEKYENFDGLGYGIWQDWWLWWEYHRNMTGLGWSHSVESSVQHWRLHDRCNMSWKTSSLISHIIT